MVNGNKVGYGDSKETEYYLLARPKINSVLLSKLKADNIRTLEEILINRWKLIGYLFDTYGLNSVDAEEVAQEQIKADKDGPQSEFYKDKRLEFYFLLYIEFKRNPYQFNRKEKKLLKLAVFILTFIGINHFPRG
jgi:hypothetical protein